MKIHIYNLGILGANCYVIETSPGRCVAVDIGGDSDLFLDELKKNNLKLNKIFLTHGHYDHICGVADVAEKTGAEVYIHIDDAMMIESAEECRALNAGISNFREITKYVSINDNAIINDGELNFTVIHTPGHTQGSVCYIADGVMFSGDTLFSGSIGRTDLPGGNINLMKSSLKRLKLIDGDYKVYPGHGSFTTLDYERKNNPYMVRL